MSRPGFNSMALSQHACLAFCLFPCLVILPRNRDRLKKDLKTEHNIDDKLYNIVIGIGMSILLLAAILGITCVILGILGFSNTGLFTASVQYNLIISFWVFFSVSLFLILVSGAVSGLLYLYVRFGLIRFYTPKTTEEEAELIAAEVAEGVGSNLEMHEVPSEIKATSTLSSETATIGPQSIVQV